MRRQYHIRRVGGRNLIWDVHRLVELTRGLKAKEIPLSRIVELDESYWSDGTNTTCRAIAQHAKFILETDLSYPIILCSQGRVMDGMHRVCKALMQNQPTISAVQFDEDPEPDYIDVELDTLPYDELEIS